MEGLGLVHVRVPSFPTSSEDFGRRVVNKREGDKKQRAQAGLVWNDVLQPLKCLEIVTHNPIKKG